MDELPQPLALDCASARMLRNGSVSAFVAGKFQPLMRQARWQSGTLVRSNSHENEGVNGRRTRRN
jgi:hypothetical protein